MANALETVVKQVVADFDPIYITELEAQVQQRIKAPRYEIRKALGNLIFWGQIRDHLGTLSLPSSEETNSKETI